MFLYYVVIILAVLHTTTFDVPKLPPINSKVKATLKLRSGCPANVSVY